MNVSYHPEGPRLASNLKVCPSCHARALAPFVGPKRRCKACGSYIDVLDLLMAESAPQARAHPPGTMAEPEAALASPLR